MLDGLIRVQRQLLWLIDAAEKLPLSELKAHLMKIEREVVHLQKMIRQ